MKLSPRLKIILFTTISALFLLGLTFFILDHFFNVHTEFGEQHHPAQIWVLRVHAIIGLWFLILAGYMFAKHIEPGLKGQKRRPSGLFLMSLIIVMFVTVPGMFYITNDSVKDVVEGLHTYLGLSLPIPFLIHWLAKKRRKR